MYMYVQRKQQTKLSKEWKICYSLSGSMCQNDILFAVGMTRSSANRLFKTELHFRSIIYIYKVTSNYNIVDLFFGKVEGGCKMSNVACFIGKFTSSL